jgi:hypothetical protein
MELQTRFGFLHFAKPFTKPRSCSCPPEFFVEASCRRARQRLARRGWARIARALLNEYDHICNHLYHLSKRYDCRIRRFRAAISHNVYRQLRHYVEDNFVTTEELCLGRRRFFEPAGEVCRIWCTDAVLAHPAATAIIVMAGRLARQEEQHRFVVVSKTCRANVAFDGGLAVVRLRVLLREHFGIAPRKQILTHLGRRLRTGTLDSNRVSPGSVIHLRN